MNRKNIKMVAFFGYQEATILHRSQLETTTIPREMVAEFYEELCEKTEESWSEQRSRADIRDNKVTFIFTDGQYFYGINFYDANAIMIQWGMTWDNKVPENFRTYDCAWERVRDAVEAWKMYFL